MTAQYCRSHQCAFKCACNVHDRAGTHCAFTSSHTADCTVPLHTSSLHICWSCTPVKPSHGNQARPSLMLTMIVLGACAGGPSRLAGVAYLHRHRLGRLPNHLPHALHQSVSQPRMLSCVVYLWPCVMLERHLHHPAKSLIWKAVCWPTRLFCRTNVSSSGTFTTLQHEQSVHSGLICGQQQLSRPESTKLTTDHRWSNHVRHRH